MLENITDFFKKIFKKESQKDNSGKEAKERLHLVLMQDRANVSADFLEMMKQEIIEVIKKYIDVDENSIDVRLTNKTNEDGTNGAPALYANIPIVSIKEEKKDELKKEEASEEEKSTNKEEIIENKVEEYNKEENNQKDYKEGYKETEQNEIKEGNHMIDSKQESVQEESKE